MSRSWSVWLSVLALAAGCLLPEGSVDPKLDPAMEVDQAMGGSVGSVGSAPDGSGGSGVGGSAPGGSGGTSMAAGSSGAAGSNVMISASGSGGAAALPTTAGAGGGPPLPNMGAAGAGGSGMRTALAECVGTTEEVTCAAYCQNYEQSCANYAPAYTYASLQDCLDTCNAATWPVGSITTKGSILCRCYHATLALNGDQTLHCFHAAEVPTLVGGCEL